MGTKGWWALAVAAFLALLGAAAYALYDSLVPLLAAFALAYAASPAVDRLEDAGLPRVWSVVMLMAGLAGTGVLFLFIVLPPLVSDAREFAVAFPDHAASAARRVGDLAHGFGVDLPVDQDAVLELLRRQGARVVPAVLKPLAGALGRIFDGAASLLVGLLNLTLIPVFFFYFLKDLPHIRAHLFDLVPPAWRPAARARLDEADAVFSGYIRGQFTVAAVLAVVFALGLALLGVRFGLLIGALAGLLNIIPYVGQLTGLVLALVMVLVDFTGWGRVLAVPALFAAVNWAEGNFLTPRLVGDKVGLGPVEIIVALIVGGELAGFSGLLLAIPAAGILKAWLRDAVTLYRVSELYGRETPPPAPEALPAPTTPAPGPDVTPA